VTSLNGHDTTTMRVPTNLTRAEAIPITVERIWYRSPSDGASVRQPVARSVDST
jgi:hypothetical protein